MKKLKPYNWLLISTLAVMPFAAHTAQAADKSGFMHYVTDNLQLPVRRGPDYTYKIINLLISGTPVTILETNEKGWAHIQYTYKDQTRDGWVPARLLTNQLVARMQLKEVQAENARLKTQIQQLDTQLSNLQAEQVQTKKLLSQTQKKLFILQKDYDHMKQTAGNALELNQENQKLKQQLAQLEEENVNLKDQIAHSEDAIKRQWFLTGAGVLLLGLILGRFARMPRRRDSWNEL